MKEDYKVIKGLVSKELCEFLALEFSMMEDTCKVLYPGANLADLCEGTFARYSPLMFEALSVHITPKIEEAVGKKLWPTYSYARIYYKGTDLKPHFDRESSEVTVSICITKEEDVSWPIFVKGETGTHEIHLDVGDAVIYSGRKSEHWREPFTGNKQIQTFLQYVDKEGSSSWLKWDTRPVLGLPFNWTNQEIQNELKHIADVQSLLKR